MLAFLAALAGIAAWWLAHQGLTAKPWLENGVGIGLAEPSGPPVPPAKLGLGVFLAVAGALFALLISSYFMRRELADWRPLPIPPVLWLNTALLIMSSLALHLARAANVRGRRDEVRTYLLLGGVSTLAFVAGQVLAWQQMLAEGFSVAGNPANTFFYLLTGMHGLHVLGGLAALGWTIERAWRDIDHARARARVELCALYWDFLLVVWLVLLALLTGFTDGLGALCGRLLGQGS